jgi:hypothetical protein
MKHKRAGACNDETTKKHMEVRRMAKKHMEKSRIIQKRLETFRNVKKANTREIK